MGWDEDSLTTAKGEENSSHNTEKKDVQNE